MSAATPRRPPVVVFLVTEDWYFVSHRLPLVTAVVRAGGRAIVATRVERHRAAIEGAGAEVVALPWDRSMRRPLVELQTLLMLWRLYRRERPLLAHHIALKAVLYGSLARLLTGGGPTVNAVAGLGFLFGGRGVAGRAARRVLVAMLRIMLRRNGAAVLLQHAHDRDLLVEAGVTTAERSVIVPGAGVDLDRFRPVARTGSGVPRVVLAARLLWEKGVAEFVAAARALRERGVAAEFVIAGEPDVANPGAVPRERLDEWHREGIVHWLGRVDDMPALLAEAAVVCLPTYYREGVPKVLLEAAASGTPVVTTDIPGCRDVVEHEGTGLLIAPRDAGALAAAVSRLLADGALRHRLGAAARRRAEAEFSDAAMVARTMALYHALASWPAA